MEDEYLQRRNTNAEFPTNKISFLQVSDNLFKVCWVLDHTLYHHLHRLILHELIYSIYNCGGWYENWLAAGESNKSVREDVDSERFEGRHIDVDPQVKLVAADEVGLVKVPAKHNQNKNALS